MSRSPGGKNPSCGLGWLLSATRVQRRDAPTLQAFAEAPLPRRCRPSTTFVVGETLNDVELVAEAHGPPLRCAL